MGVKLLINREGIFCSVNFKMEMAPGGAVRVTGVAHHADFLAAAHIIAHFYESFIQMGVAGFRSIRMLYKDKNSVAVIPSALAAAEILVRHHKPFRRGVH